MAATPPPVAMRAHTPPTPLHGARYDNYEPYSPRRSKRTTAQSNPYSSFNGERSPNTSFQRHTTPPPTTGKRARFARAPTQLSSPPSSPASPRVQKVNAHKTPRSKNSRSKSSNFTILSDSEGGGGAGPSNSASASTSKASTLAPTIDPTTMLPTPSKTPTNKNRAHAAAITSTARILSFQPAHPNDAMPSPRRMKKSQQHRGIASRAGFELYEDDISGLDGTNEGEADIQVYTDTNARVPVWDESEDNPFVGPKRSSSAVTRPQRRKQKRSAVDEEMEERVGRGEGVVYVFRGKKIFRAFADGEAAEGEVEEGTADQRRLRHQAGVAAQRPLTRSAIQPRLLFPSAEQRRERGAAAGVEVGPWADDVDEEAVTDIEMDVTHPTTSTINTGDDSLVSPPPTHRKKRTIKVPLDGTPGAAAEGMESIDEDGDPMSLGTDESFSSVSSAGKNGKRKGKSPFDGWQRTKSSRKRGGEAVEEGVGGSGVKRSKGAGGSSML